MDKDGTVLILGSNGLVGSALVRKLTATRDSIILTTKRKELNLLDRSSVEEYFSKNKPNYVFLAAAKVGGIMANKTQPASFGYENSMITLNVLQAARETAAVKKLLFLGSSCIYPKEAPVPIQESSLLTGKLESSNELYALSKILGIKLCQAYREQYGCNFISCMPSNLYGPNDNFDENNSHVLPALIRKIHAAKKEGLPEITCWGDGTPLREFLYVDDLASACVFLMGNYNDPETINVGTGKEVSIQHLVYTICDMIGYTGNVVWDVTKPNGTLRKTMDVSRIKTLGWTPDTPFHIGLNKTIEWYIANKT